VDDDIIATVVTWLPVDPEMPLDEVNEAIAWVVEEQHSARVLVPPVACLTFPSYDACRVPGAEWDRRFKGYVGGRVREFAIVVSDRPLSEEQADEVLKEHYRLQTEEVMQPEDVDQDSHGGDVGQFDAERSGG
jgi:hypothetical protein